MNTAVIPRPNSVTKAPGQFTLTSDAGIAASIEHSQIVRRLLAPALGGPMPRREIAVITVTEDDSLPAEGYRLAVGADGIQITAADDSGVQWATQTLKQLMGPSAFYPAPVQNEWPIECVFIEDSPRFAWRGNMLDVGRHFVSIASLYRYVDLLAMHKQNVFHLHLTEDQGWRFESKKYPKLTESASWRRHTETVAHGSDGTPHGGYYTQDQLRSLVQYAAERGVTVVPEIEFPGHMTAALAAYPEFACPGYQPTETACGFGILEDVLNLSDEAMQFVYDIWEEVLDIFPSKHVHIGGDEAPKTQWVGNPPMEERAKELGLADASLLQRWFTEQLTGWLIEKGRIPIGWDEVCDEGPVPGVVCGAWRESGKYGVAPADAGMQVIAAPNMHTYFDYYASDAPDEPYQIGNLITTEQAYNWDPTDGHSQAGAENVIGTQSQIWTEFMPTYERMEYQLWPRNCAHAEVAWSATEGKNWDDFSTRLETHLERLEALGVNYRPESGPLPHQQGGTGLRQRPETQAAPCGGGSSEGSEPSQCGCSSEN